MGIEDQLRRIIVDDLFVEIAPETIGLDESLRDVVGLDSVGFVELRAICERRFNVQIFDEDYTPGNFSTVRRLTSLINRLHGNESPEKQPQAQ
jgi:acyl carrier protein